MFLLAVHWSVGIKPIEKFLTDTFCENQNSGRVRAELGPCRLRKMQKIATFCTPGYLKLTPQLFSDYSSYTVYNYPITYNELYIQHRISLTNNCAIAIRLKQSY